MPEINEVVTIGPLARDHARAEFQCGEGRIDNYLRNTAYQEHKAYKIRVFTATAPGSNIVLGFYSLTFVVWNIETGQIDEKMAKKFAKAGPVPSIYLAKLGVTSTAARQGIGAALMRDAFKRALVISEHAAISTLTLEAINEEKAAWYEKLGLERFTPGDLKMAIGLATLRKA